jgi:hypothetical protein
MDGIVIGGAPDTFSASGDVLFEAYRDGVVSGGGICIGNCGIETEMFGAMERVTLLAGGSITNISVPSYDLFLAIFDKSTTGGSVVDEFEDEPRLY